MATPVEIAVKATGTAAASRSLGSVESKTSKLGSALKAAAVGGVALAGAALVKFGADSVRAASDAQQSIGATETVFGKYADTVIKRSDQAAKAVGLSANEYRELANVTGASLAGAGIPIKKVTGLTGDLTKRAADMAATFGGTTREAIESVGSALRGETDPIERYGVSIKASDVSARLAATGQDKLTGSALKQAEMMTRLKLIFDKTKSSQGAFAREGDTLAGAQQRLSAQIENVEAKFGELLLPILTDAANLVMDKVIPAAEDLADWFAENQDEIGRFGTSVKDGLLPPLKTLGGVVRDVVGFIAKLPGPVQSFGAEAVAAAFLLPKLTGALGTARGAASGFAGSIRNAETRTRALQQGAKMLAGAAGIALITDASNDAEGGMKELKDTAGKTALAFAVGGPIAAGFVAFADIVGSAQSAGEDFGLSQEEMSRQIDQVTASLNKQTGAFTKRTREQLVADLGDKGLLQTANDMNIELPKLVRATMQGSQGIQRFRTQYLSSLPDNQRAKFIDLTETLFDMSDALITGQRGFILEREAAGKSGKAIQAHREKVRALADQYFILPRQVSTILKSVGADATKKNVRDLAKQYDLTPKEVRTIFRTFGTDKAQKDAKDTRRDLEDVGKARANVAQWVRDITSGANEGRQRANQGADGVSRALRDGTGKARANLAPFGSSLFSALSGLTGRASSSAAGVGRSIAAGMSQGIASNAWQAVNAAGAMVTQAIAEANRRADAHSPSRRMRQLGRNMTQGLVLGFDDGSAGVAKVLGRLTSLIQTTYAQRARAARKRIDNAKAERAALRHLEQAENARTKTLKRLDDALVANGKRQDQNNAKLEAARGKLKEILQTSRDYASSIREAVVSTGDVTTLGKDEAGTATIGGILDQMRARVQAAQRYADLIAKLTKAGLNKTSLQQLLSAGVEGGLSTAEALASGGPAAIAQINKLTGQLTDVGEGLGTSAADTMYGAGIKAAEGLVKGLEAKEKAIDKVARRLATTLANAVRRALRVQSPSRVFEDIGKRTVEGLQVGLDDTHVRQSGRKLAASLVDGFSDPKLTATAVLDATTGAGGGAPTVRVELTAAQVDALQRGRGIRLDVDAFGAAGGRRVAKVVR